MNKRVLIFVLLTVIPFVCSAEIRVENGWVRLVPPVTGVTAAYLNIRNTGSEAVSLTGVKSPVAGEASLHSTSMANGMMKMRPVESVLLKAGEVAKFMPGGMHIMLMGLKSPLKVGDKVPLTLIFKSSQPVSILLPVKMNSEGDETQMKGMHHHMP